MSTRRTGKHRIYMNVGYDLTEEQLRQFFSQYGDVTDVYLPKHKSGRNKGFGFTTFDSDEALQAALQAEEYLIGGEVVRINRAGPRPESELQRESEVLEASSSGTNLKQLDGCSRQPQVFGKGPRLYVGGIPEEVSEERLKAHFSRWGNVVDLYFPGKKGQSRVNYCFVTFDNWRAAQRACNQSERNIDGLPLQSINLAQERTPEQEAAQRADSLSTAPAIDSQPQSQPAAPAFGATPFGADGITGNPPLPAYNVMQQLHLQVLQAQALQAQQSRAGLAAQLQQPSPNLMPPATPDAAQMAAFLATNPVAYQQLLATMAASQGFSLQPNFVGSAPSPFLQPNPAMAMPAGYSMAGASPFQFTQAITGVPSDLNSLLAPGLQPGLTPQAAEHQSAPQQGAQPLRHDTPMDTSRMSSLLSSLPNSMPGFPSQQPPTAPGPSPMGFAPGSPSMWGWGGPTAGEMFSGCHGATTDANATNQSPFANPQAQLRPGSSAVPALPRAASHFGALSLDGYGPRRTPLFAKICNPYAPY